MRPVVTSLEKDQLGQAWRLLKEDPIVNLLALYHLERVLSASPPEGMSLLGAWKPEASSSWWRRGRRVLCGFALVTPGGLALPWSSTPEEAWALGQRVGPRRHIVMLLGRRETCDAFFDGLDRSVPPRIRYDQRLYTCAEPPKGPGIGGFRTAEPRDLDTLCYQGTAMMLEDLGFDPAAANPDAHRRGVLARIEAGLTWVVEQDGEIIFKIDAGGWTDACIMVGGTYVPPHRRNQGIATRSMRTLLEWLLNHHGMVALHVNEANPPAVQVYQEAGMRRADALRLIMPD